MFASALLLTALEWTAPVGCPNGADVEQMVQLMLADADGPRLAARASTVPTPEGFELTVEVGDQRRTLRSSSCDELAGAAALIIAVANDPVRVAAEIEARQSSEPEVPLPALAEPAPSLPAAPPPSIPTARETEPPARDAPPRRRDDDEPEVRVSPRPRGFGLRPQVGLSFSVLPRPRPAFALAAAWMLGTLRLEAAPFGVLASTTDTEPANARVWMAGVGVRACWAPALGNGTRPVAAELCGGAEVAAMRARGGGSEISGTGVTQAWAGGLASAGVLVPLSGRVALAVRGEFVVALRQPGVHVDGVGPVFRAGAVGGRVWLGPEFRFP